MYEIKFFKFFITLYLGSIGIDCVISEACYKPLYGHFPVISLYNSMVKNKCHNMTELY